MGYKIAMWFFERKLSMFELTVILIAVTLTEGFWPLFIITVVASFLADHMQNVLGTD